MSASLAQAEERGPGPAAFPEIDGSGYKRYRYVFVTQHAGK
jgi:hypothetical protein